MKRPVHALAGIARAALLLAVLAGCEGATEPAPVDDGSCVQTYEFGNTGCLEIHGQVVGMAAQPLAGIAVVARAPSAHMGYAAAYVTTDVNGGFRVRLTRMFGAPPPTSGPDTASVYVIAADPRSAGVGVPGRIRDSVLVQASLARVGQVPTPTVARVALLVP
jgi:hypothetical protein